MDWRSGICFLCFILGRGVLGPELRLRSGMMIPCLYFASFFVDSSFEEYIFSSSVLLYQCLLRASIYIYIPFGRKSQDMTATIFNMCFLMYTHQR